MHRRRIAQYCAAALFALAAALGAHAQTPTCDKNHYILRDPLNGWVPTGDLNTPRSGHTATLLSDGRVLVAGGRGPGNTALSSAELYDPATGTWTVTGSLSRPRSAHTATLLPNGKVLVVGGEDLYGEEYGPTLGLAGTAELYDPATGMWSPTGNLNTPRFAFTATLLTTGKVLVAGGVDNSDASLNSSELYDPEIGTWSFTGDLITARFDHTATLLEDGTVLAVAGWTDDFFQTVTSDVELYDPITGSWSSAAGLHLARVLHTATRLQDGRVLVVGGYRTAPDYIPTSFSGAELYDPTSGTWSAGWNIVGSLQYPREGHTATLLPDGEVLVAGGFHWTARVMIGLTELYEPASAEWNGAGYLGSPRIDHTATLLPNGKVLVAGGYLVVLPSYANISLASAELHGNGTNECP
jgi:hypothetical protein